MKVELTPVSGLPQLPRGTGQQGDMAWYGGFTFVQANICSGGKVIPLVQREDENEFRSAFITSDPVGIKSLADLKGKTVSLVSVQYRPPDATQRFVAGQHRP
jgi:phosphonate transport system substrate-binding protein